MTAPFISLTIGNEIVAKGRAYKITHHLGADSLLATDLETGKPERITIDEITPAASTQSDEIASTTRRDLGDYSDEEWAQAQHRFEAIRPLLDDPSRTRARVETIAAVHGVHPGTIYEWLKFYQQSGHLSSLIPRKRGRRRGDTRLSPQVETIIDSAISDLYLKPQKATPQEVANEVHKRCTAAGLPRPHANSVRNRIRALNSATVLRKQGRRDQARNLYEPIRGKFPGADYPLAVVEIDHTQADIIVVEERSRLPMGRPWLTLAIDVYSRMVVGIYISMERPDSAAVGLCLSQAILPKRKYLADLEVPGSWPVWGTPGIVHTDNAREFRGAMLKRACQTYGIDIQQRPAKLPHYGGHIERLMRTVATELRKLPGATFSSPQERKGYDSDKESALTLRQFERIFVDSIVNIYHQRPHRELKVTPIRQWEIGTKELSERPTGLPPIPSNPERLILDFLPFVTRTVQPYGLVIDEIHYYHEVLNPWINSTDPEHSSKKRQFTIRRDPRDISVVHFYDPEIQQYFPIPYRNSAHPSVNLWEVREAQKRLKAEGVKNVDEGSIFSTVDRIRNIADDAIVTSRKARRVKHRTDGVRRIEHDKRDVNSERSVPMRRATILPQTAFNAAEEDDIFSSPIEPFSDLGGAI